jgi:hypothetical protein
MAEPILWEYRAVGAGSFWSMPKDEELEALLNELGEEGWEVVSVFAQNNSNRVRVVAKRPLTQTERRRRSWLAESLP